MTPRVGGREILRRLKLSATPFSLSPHNNSRMRRCCRSGQIPTPSFLSSAARMPRLGILPVVSLSLFPEWEINLNQTRSRSHTRLYASPDQTCLPCMVRLNPPHSTNPRFPAFNLTHRMHQNLTEGMSKPEPRKPGAGQASAYAAAMACNALSRELESGVPLDTMAMSQ